MMGVGARPVKCGSGGQMETFWLAERRCAFTRYRIVRDRALNPLNVLPGTVPSGVGQYGHEFVSSESADQVHRTVLLVEELAERPQDLVSGEMTERVVHGLEVVDVEDDDGEASPAPGRSDFVFQMELEASAVRETGKGVGEGQGPK